MRLSTAESLVSLHEPLLASSKRQVDRLTKLVVATETEDRWSDATACDAWDRRAMLLHLRHGRELLLQGLRGTDPFEGRVFDPNASPQRYIDANAGESASSVASSFALVAAELQVTMHDLADSELRVRSTWGGSVDWRQLAVHVIWDNLIHERDLLGDATDVHDDDLRLALGNASLMGSLGVAFSGTDAWVQFAVAEPATTVSIEVRGGEVVVEVTAGAGGGPPLLEVLEAMSGRGERSVGAVLDPGAPFAASMDGFRTLLMG